MPYEVKYYTRITIELGERSGELGRFSFFPKGALTHHPKNRAVVSLPVVRLVRSPRGMWLLRKPMDDAAIAADTVIIVHTGRELNIKQFTTCFINLPPAAL